MSRHLSLIAPTEVQRRIGEGEPLVVSEGYVLDLGQWINTHPGGRLSILHMVGRDATDEINMSVESQTQYSPSRTWSRRA